MVSEMNLVPIFDLLTAVYWICTIVGGGLVLISTLSGGDSDSHLDVDTHVDLDVDMDVDVDVDVDVGANHFVCRRCRTGSTTTAANSLMRGSIRCTRSATLLHLRSLTMSAVTLFGRCSRPWTACACPRDWEDVQFMMVLSFRSLPTMGLLV